MDVARALLRTVPAFRRSMDQVPAYAAAWEAANAVGLAGEGPLWVVLGDSTAQAVGIASGIEHGYVGRVRRLLEARDGVRWRVLNLSRSGAVLADVRDEQLPRVPAGADLVTCVAGGNDLRRTPLEALLAVVSDVLAAVPAGTVVATMPRGLKEARARSVNDLLRSLAAARGLPVADLWAHTGPPYRGRYADGLHPNEAGTAGWVAALAAALGLPAEDRPSAGPQPP